MLMLLRFRNPIACSGVGTNLTGRFCCYANDLNSAACHDLFTGKNNTLLRGCDSAVDCISDCADKIMLYTSFSQEDPGKENGKGAVNRYQACVNPPSIARYSPSDRVSRDFATEFTQYSTPKHDRSLITGSNLWGDWLLVFHLPRFKKAWPLLRQSLLACSVIIEFLLAEYQRY